MKVLKYGRKTKKKEKYHFRDQLYEINNYCKSHGLEVIGGKKEIGDGCTLDRPALQELLKIRRKENIGGIVIAATDRLTRNVGDFNYLWDLAKREGFVWIVARDDIWSDNELSYKLMKHDVEFAQRELTTMSVRIKAALRAIKECGKKTGGPTKYGYDSSKSGKLSINLKEFDTIKLIVHLKKSKELSYNKIAAILNESKIPSKLGLLWYASTVRNIYLREKDNI